MSPLGKLPPANDVNAKLKYAGRFGWVVARLTAPFIKSPYTLNHLIATTRRDIYAETVDAMGYDPLARRDEQRPG